jgi:hypothetical protein
MTITVVLALLVSPGVGLVADRFVDEGALAEVQAAELDERMRAGLLEQGFAPIAGKDRSSAERIARATGVELLSATQRIELELAGGTLRAFPPKPSALEPAIRVLEAELGRYPRAFFSATRLRRVLLCRGLVEGERIIPSLPNYEYSLLLDVEAPEHFLRRLVHHEAFHFADFADDGQLANDSSFAKLNDRYFVYGSGGRFERDPAASALSDALPGFVSRYAASALEEDKAEVFSFWMTMRRDMEQIALRDPIVQGKVNAVRAQLVALVPEMYATLR